ncbi:pyridoxamine 5'-phosphate oxidase family protein [Rhizobium sp. KVB221]|uniref:Pyridoxamine 5'-phosphate oxidase family protein n=1 Tax=Rhizobium setariae TaxID=2801340 RepID=A0A937CQI6_9HYPH|nr:pyridoxamine 5'-phosphate oxidase family protein [Rhizobium setariae]MBL0374529.1 pyridoxamine 5'-phosphate oxidase family protein [Rhizobium setariae]
MQLDEGLKQFLKKPLMIIVGTAGAECRPAIARAVGVFLPSEGGHIDITISSWQWPETIANIHDTGRLAATFVCPSDYVTYQMKGKAWLRSPDADDYRRSDHFIDAIRAELIDLGVPGMIAAPWLTNRDAMVATLAVSEIYVQTPGPNAGRTAGRPS